MISKRTFVISAVMLGTGFWAIGCGNAGDSEIKTDVRQNSRMSNANHDHNTSNVDEVSSSIVQKTCPVMGNPINKDLYADYDGKRIHVCCGACIDRVKGEPEKYLKKLAEMGEQAVNIHEMRRYR